MKNWYIVQTFSGFEQKVAETLKDIIKKQELSEKIDNVLVKMEMNKELYHMIKNIQKVTGFLGGSGSPASVSEKEIDKIMGSIKEGTLVPKTQVTFDIGEQVRVCEGPFASFSGLVEEVDEEKSRLKVSVSIFGRPTPIELEYNQVEKN